MKEPVKTHISQQKPAQPTIQATESMIVPPKPTDLQQMATMAPVPFRSYVGLEINKIPVVVPAMPVSAMPPIPTTSTLPNPIMVNLPLV